MFKAPSDVAFSFLGFPVYYYGIILAFSVFIGIYGAYRIYKKYFNYFDAEFIIDFSPWLILSGITGARLYYCAVNYSYYMSHPGEIFYFRQGGLSIHGAVIAGVAALYFFSKKYKMPFFKLTDAFSCSTILAQSIGRWGNFFNSEAFGHPTNLPWKLYIPLSHRPEQFIQYDYFHPAFLYESILDLIIFFVLFTLFKKFTSHSGVITCFYLIFYSAARIFVEQIRVDSVLNIHGIPSPQIISVFIILLASLLLRRIYHT